MDSLRNTQKKAFLKSYFVNTEYQIQPLVFDASFRKYDRIVTDQNSLILMDSPPEHYTLADFTNIANFLRKHGFSAPELFKEDHNKGFLLLEDFGSVSINNHLAQITSNAERFKIYQLMIDLLCEIHNLSPPQYLPLYDYGPLLKELEVYIEWYLPYKNNQPLTQNAKDELNIIWHNILDKLPNFGQYFLYRDFHVDNLMLLSREGIKAIGLLDFQEAKIGSPFYDLASILEDARIDVKPDFAMKCFDYYLQKNLSMNRRMDREAALLTFNILAAQRNSRVLGVFMRKHKRDNQSSFLNYIPRVENYLKNNLQHPIFRDLRNWLENRNLL